MATIRRSKSSKISRTFRRFHAHCFQYREDAEKVVDVLRKRFVKYGLTLHPEKTRLMEFGRKALAKSEEAGGRKPATFDFLGFTHICKRSRRGDFTIHVRTMRKRRRIKGRDK